MGEKMQTQDHQMPTATAQAWNWDVDLAYLKQRWRQTC